MLCGVGVCLVCAALSAGGESEMFRRREWSFTLRDDIYIRFQSFATENDFRRALMDKLPFKIDIGACYNASVRTIHTTTLNRIAGRSPAPLHARTHSRR